MIFDRDCFAENNSLDLSDGVLCVSCGKWGTPNLESICSVCKRAAAAVDVTEKVGLSHYKLSHHKSYLDKEYFCVLGMKKRHHLSNISNIYIF